MQTQPALVDKFPRLLAVLASPHPFLNILFSMPLAYLFFTIPGASALEFKIQAVVGFLLGLVYWSFVEYGIHCWIYHGKYRHPIVRQWVEAFHIYHHQNLEDHRVLTAGPLMVYVLSVVLLSPVYVLGAGSVPTFVSAVGLGLISYYLFYEWVHYSIHRRAVTSRYMKWITEYHMDHHKKWNYRFGNTTSIWDRVFRTYK